MTQEDLIIGNVYICKIISMFIFLYEGDLKNCLFCMLDEDGDLFNFNKDKVDYTSFHYTSVKLLRTATDTEREAFLKFMNHNILSDNYQIF